MFKWLILPYKIRNKETGKYYAYWSDENNRKYSTWYYEPFDTEEIAHKWIRDINFGRIPFNTTSLTATKY